MIYIRATLVARRVCRCAAAFVLVTLLALPLPAVSQSGSEPLTLNFRNVEIRQIIESVGELTGRNFLIDPRVRGKVTILANEPVPQNALYDVLLSILRMHGFRAVEGENLTRVLPGNVAARFKPEFGDEQSGDSEKLVTTIISVKHLNAATIIPMIKPLMTPEAQVLVNKETNKLLITEINANLERVRKIIGRIDIADVGDFEIIPLNYADAKDIVGLVQRASNQNLRHLAQVVADKEGNRVILTGPSSVRRSLRALIAELDSETITGAAGRIRVIRLHYARAEDIESIIRGLLSSSEFIKTLGGEGAYPEQSAAQTRGDQTGKQDEPRQEQRDDKGKTGGSGKRNYVIQVDKALNALIVGGPPRVLAAVERLVREIDVPRPQVLIEAIFADTSQEKAFNLGTQLSGGKGVEVSDGLPVFSDSDQDIVQGIGAIFTGGSPEISDFLLGGQGSFRGNPINFLISAIRTDEDSRVLSTPSVLTLNNEEATIDVSDVISIRTGTTNPSEGGNTSTFERQEFGTTLKVQPQITEGDAVRLDIEYKTEEVLPTSRAGGVSTEETGDPDSRKREIKTSVLVNDGDILVLGGLSNEQATEDQSRVPVLGAVPVLGHLFRGRSSSRNRTTLMVFIRPTILRNADEGGQASRARYAKLRLEQLMDAQDTKTLLPEADQMVLPGLPLKVDKDRKVKRKKKVIKRKKRRRSDSG